MLITLSTVTVWTAIAFTWRVWNNWIDPHNASIQHLENSNLPTSETSKKLRDAQSVVKDKTDEAMEWTKDKANDAIDWTKDKAHDATEWTNDKAHKTQSTASDIFTRLRHRLTGVSPTREYYEGPTSRKQAMQIRVMPNEYVVFLDAAGIPPSNLHVQLARNQLVLYGEHEECSGRACWERAIEEVFDLPEDAEQEAIESYVHLQVLVIKIPRKPILAEREIKIDQKSALGKIFGKVGLE